MKKLAVLGSTGSVGPQTLQVVENQREMEVRTLAAGGNIRLLERQIRQFGTKVDCVWEDDKAKELAFLVRDLPVRIVSGMEGLLEAATENSVDTVVAAVVGMIGIWPVMAAISAGKDIALANKETLVTAGHLIMPLAKEKGVKILPVDSEQSAILQCLNGERENRIRRLLLTAYGGPFRGKTKKELESVTVEDALKHPNWSMGKKITIDSATLVNKGLEVIEAKWLFDVDLDRISVVVQPGSVIHSMVEFEDGAVIAQLGTPDMKLPIQYALTYPKRQVLPGQRLDFETLGQIAFEKPDVVNFPGLSLAYQAGRAGGTLPTVFNAANERAVAKFLNHEIPYLSIAQIIEEAMNGHTVKENPALDEILQAEAQTYEYIESRW